MVKLRADLQSADCNPYPHFNWVCILDPILMIFLLYCMSFFLFRFFNASNAALDNNLRRVVELEITYNAHFSVSLHPTIPALYCVCLCVCVYWALASNPTTVAAL